MITLLSFRSSARLDSQHIVASDQKNATANTNTSENEGSQKFDSLFNFLRQVELKQKTLLLVSSCEDNSIFLNFAFLTTFFVIYKL